MNLQDAFYILGIIYMSLCTFFLIAIIVLLFYIKNKITVIYEDVQAKIAVVEHIVHNPREAAAEVGSRLAKQAFDKLANMGKTKEKK